MAIRIFQRERRSLFGEILDWMLTPLLLLWPVSLALTWLVAQNIAGKPFDRALEYNVQALSKLVVVKNNVVQFNLTGPAREILRADDTDLVYYQVIGTHGETLSGERELPQPSDDDKLQDGDVRLRQVKEDLHRFFGEHRRGFLFTTTAAATPIVFRRRRLRRLCRARRG